MILTSDTVEARVLVIDIVLIISDTNNDTRYKLDLKTPYLIAVLSINLNRSKHILFF